MIISFSTRDELIKIDLRQVAFFESDANYVNIYYIRGGKTASLLSTLEDIYMLISETTDKEHFVRVGRKHIVNTDYVFRINMTNQNVSFLSDSAPMLLQIRVSKAALAEFRVTMKEKLGEKIENFHPKLSGIEAYIKESE